MSPEIVKIRHTAENTLSNWQALSLSLFDWIEKEVIKLCQ